FGDNNAWLRWRGGDGGYSAWDQQISNYIYGSNPRGNIFGSSNSGNTVQTMALPDTTGALFIQPIVLNPKNGNQLLVGTDNVFYSSNARLLANATWQDVSGELPSGSSVSALSFSPVANSQIYVGMQSGHIYTITALGSSNNVADISPPISGSSTGTVTSVIADPSDASGNTLYATRAGYFADRIIKSTNGGSSWFSISGDLPDMPLYRVSVDPTDSSRLFVGSEMGLWVTESNGNNDPYHWVRYHYGTAFTRVIDLVWHQDDTLFVATHGRGTYKASRNGLDISLNKFVTTDSSCDNDGVLDAGESGLLMVNLTNQGGFDVKNAVLSIAQQNTLIIENDIINVGTIPAMGSVFVPIEVSLIPAASCLAAVDLDISVNYSGGSSQTLIELITAADQTVNATDFIDGAESSETMMQSKLDLGNNGWTRVSSSSNSGANSWFTTDEASYSDKSLISPWLTLDAGGNVLSFALSYNTEGDSTQRWDGALLEIREPGGTWVDIGNLSSVPYDGRLHTNNTAQARMVWSGQQVGWRSATVNLAETYQGKTIQFRFRMISDSSVSAIGFFVDDIRMSNVIWNELPSCDSCQNEGGFVPFSGFWYDRGKSGHGFVVEPVGRDNLYFVVFYSYGDDGKPEWYTSLVELVDGVLNIDFNAGTLQRVLYDFSIDPTTGPAFADDPALTDGRLSLDFNLQNAASHPACQDGVSRQEDSIAVVSWKINSQQGDWCIEPLIAERNKGYPDFGGIWWSGAADSGWGFSLAQTKSGLVAVIYYYDGSGKPRWVIGQADFSKGETITVQMNEVLGFGRTDTPIPINTISAGSLQIKIDNALNNLNIDGSVTVDISYQGVEGGQWQRVDLPIGLFTQKH
ncbi:MAG: immune inhibitor A, partial [Proteobacteria bacterium]|nr:immune inhibitor A [Pseudomonadota bacterium]